jgi:hypothetical protein
MEYAEGIQILQQEFSSWFQVFKSMRGRFQFHLILMSKLFQTTWIWRYRFTGQWALQGYTFWLKFCLPGNKFPVLRKHAWQMTHLFGSTYFSEQFFWKINVGRNTSRIWLDSERLESCLCIATSQMCPDINTLMAKKQCLFLIDILLLSEVDNPICNNVHFFLLKSIK